MVKVIKVSTYDNVKMRVNGEEVVKVTFQIIEGNLTMR